MGMIPLKQALRLEDAPQVALVGAGGKSSALFQLARQFEGPVLLTTSTHLSGDQAGWGDKHIEVQETGDWRMETGDLEGVTVVTGTRLADDRLSGLAPAALISLSAYARANGLPLLIEADGARQRALKAPAEHEPAIPDFVDSVVVLAGLSALGQPLDAEHVHRPEIFAAFSGLAIGETITADALAAVLAHPEGGLKGIPGQARRILLLNQVEGERLAGAARGLARRLLGHYQAVLAASLQGEAGVHAVYERTAGVLLAAGGAERLGSPKQLLDWNGQPFVRAVAKTGLAAGLDPLVVVTGAYAEEVEAALDGLGLQIVHNADWQQGQAGSVKAGGAALPADVGSAIFMVVDQPQLPVALLEALQAQHARTLAPIVATQVDGNRSNPVLFDRATFEDFTEIQGDQGGRALFARYKVEWLTWLDSSLAIDVDSLEDYNRLLNYAD
jgi:molybdenum cofactor cytidylyltransferase